MQLMVIAGGWLLVIAGVVRTRIHRQPHRHWVAGLETLRDLHH